MVLLSFAIMLCLRINRETEIVITDDSFSPSAKLCLMRIGSEKKHIFILSRSLPKANTLFPEALSPTKDGRRLKQHISSTVPTYLQGIVEETARK